MTEKDFAAGGSCSSTSNDGSDISQADVSRIPPKFLNPLGFIAYDHYGVKPWNNWDEVKEGIFLSDQYKSVTQVLGLDCEMVGVGQYKHSALGRVSIVNEYGYCIYDYFVKPKGEVTDYRTNFSGIRAEDLSDARDSEIVLKEVSEIVDSKVLVGHSIHNDLDVLRLNNHPRSLIRDTSIYLRKELKTRGFPSLRDLASKYLRINIQTGEHSSVQDAQGTLKLYLIHREKWEADFHRRRENAKLTLSSHVVSTETPDDISDMHVEPREPDLFVNSETVFLRENKIVGAYSSSEEYLDIQFRLLLEDFLRPLRDGVQNVDQWRRFKKNTIFHNVQIRIEGKKNNVEVRQTGTILVPILRNNLKDIDWEEETNIFKNGSLLLFTPDNFKSIKFAVIKFRYDIPEPEDQINFHFIKVCVEFSKHGPSWTIGENNNRFMMMESTAFYEAYKHTLEYLQTVNMNIFPMKKYIIDVVTTPQPPKYLFSVSRKLDFSVLMTKTQVTFISEDETKADPLDFKNWPNANQLNLDESQFEAFQKALTQEMTIIQGPPGTGKTFIGIQIVKLLLKNLWLLNSPILIVAYTNHALDQTLELLLDFVITEICTGKEKEAHTKILRVGGGSKSEKIQPLVLRNKLEKYKEKKRLYKKLDLVTKIVNSVKDLDFSNLLLNQGILDFQKLPKVILDKLSQDSKSKKVFQTWNNFQSQMKKDPLSFFGFPDSIRRNIVQKKDPLLLISFAKCYPLEFYFDFLYKTHAENWINSVNMSILSHIMYSNANETIMLKARLTHYFYLVSCVKDLVQEMTLRLMVLQKEYAELENILSRNLSIQSAVVIGMTTTGAVKYKDIVHKTKPKIMIVEEAAHVLEAHVVSSLTEHCQQMVMIGDHKQLRPLTADYNLATDYNLDVSLMERLVNNGIHQENQNWTQLKVQHRMRPEIARMICPVIYEELYNHEDVMKYPDVKTFSKNLFFVDHKNSEGKEKGSRSYFNEHEANVLSELVQYFVSGHLYQPHQITVIATYLAQKVLIENKLKRQMGCDQVKVSTVDGFQGEENDIILLSLVRSNDENRVGFLKTDNRVCVALSRARHGLFMIGNMSCLMAESETWKDINNILVTMESIGSGISIPALLTKSESLESSAVYNNNLQQSTSTAIYNNNPSSLVEQIILPRCKIVESESSPVTLPEPPPKVTPKPVLKLLPCGHKQILSEKQLKNISTVKCNQSVNKMLRCGHSGKVECHRKDVVEILCTISVIKPLICGHQKILPCHLAPTSKDCITKSLQQLPCGHNRMVCCAEQDMICTVDVSCGHRKKMPCYQALLTPCYALKKAILPCGHLAKVPCTENISNIQCNLIIVTLFPCGHLQKHPCGLKNQWKCSIMVSKKLICGHEQVDMCCLSPSETLCKILVPAVTTFNNTVMVECFTLKNAPTSERQCEKIFSCGHQCRLLYHGIESSAHNRYQCTEKCQRSCPKGHRCDGNHQCYQLCPVSKKKCNCKKKSADNSANIGKSEFTNTEIKTENCSQPAPSITNWTCEHFSNDSCKSKSIKTCSILVDKELPCGHKVQASCSKKASKIECRKMLESTFPCGHTQKYLCNSPTKKCSKYINKTLPCGHNQMGACHQSPADISCRTLVPSYCSHKVMVTCDEARNDPSACNCQCERILECGHRCPLICHEDDEEYDLQINCYKECGKLCKNGHRCPSNHKCYKNCPFSVKECKCANTATRKCKKSCPNGHTCPGNHGFNVKCPFISHNLCPQCVVTKSYESGIQRLENMTIG